MQECPARILLVDGWLPDGRGWDLVREIRASYEEAIILGMSGDCHEDEFLNAGAVGFLEKPMSVKKLRSRLQELVSMLEGISLQLDPDINVFDEVEPYVRDAILELQSPVARIKEVADQLRVSAEALVLLPQQLQRMIEQIETGEADLSMTLKGLDEPTQRITSAANRLVLAILAAAFVLGPALLIPSLQSIFGEWRTGAAILVIAGFAVSGLLTIILILSVLRTGR